jgi:hypothetical protein
MFAQPVLDRKLLNKFLISLGFDVMIPFQRLLCKGGNGLIKNGMNPMMVETTVSTIGKVSEVSILYI